MSRDNIDYYLGLPYPISLYPAEEGGYVVEIPDLPGCISQGETIGEALEMIGDAKIVWLEIALADGIKIPEPSKGAEQYSGKINLRMPKSLHRILTEKAKEEKVSLNQYINFQLSKGVGFINKNR